MVRLKTRKPSSMQSMIWKLRLAEKDSRPTEHIFCGCSVVLERVCSSDHGTKVPQ